MPLPFGGQTQLAPGVMPNLKPFARYDLQEALGLDLLQPGDMVDVTVNAKVGDIDLVATDTLVITE